ncbi:MAG: hypothetical protein M1825_001533 [Sarcosagium campestre]|nr:MAG: hypothetical protein M1825_001533 [Sarcosagium campestre]
MSLPSWTLPPHVRHFDHAPGHGERFANGLNGISSRPRTPSAMGDGASLPDTVNGPMDGDTVVDEFPGLDTFKTLYAQSESKIAALFSKPDGNVVESEASDGAVDAADDENGTTAAAGSFAGRKRTARTIDEDDYDDYDDAEEAEEDDEDEEGHGASQPSPLKGKGSVTVGPLAARVASPLKPQLSPPKSSPSATRASAAEQSKTSEEVRKKLEEDKKATEDAAKRSFHTLFYTLEHDRDAMLEQQKLEELDRQVDAEMLSNGANAANPTSNSAGPQQQGKLSSANLGASSLTLKHLIARIDAKRDQVIASDSELRSLMSEVRKNRSKWANEDRVGQEELYEAADKVLSELKAMTEHSTAFLTRVNKREAPDYYNIIKHPMDLGTMTKKLKSFAYKSKQDFVDDLNLIWANCLKYNADPSHFLRKRALAMVKETDKLVPLIPDIVIRDRAEVEAEERRMQNGGVDADIDGGEESDDEPIMSSRGRKAPGKGHKGSNAAVAAAAARKAPKTDLEGSPSVDTKPSLQPLNIKNDLARADSDVTMDGSQNGLSTPPPPGGPGSFTPGGMNGATTTGGSQADPMELDGFASSVSGMGIGHGAGGQVDDVEYEDVEFKTWKQVTKKDRALVAAERNRLFKGDQLNADEPALLRTKAGMRRWLRQQRQALAEGATGEKRSTEECREGEEVTQTGETLAEGMEGEDESVLPDYYDPLAAIPEVPERLRWVEDADGQLIDQSEEFLRVVPKGHFTSPESVLTRKMEANMRQMQETRKVCSKIGVIKQMQLQSQMYQNQFQKYNPEPFVEQDIDALVVSDDGPIMSPWVCRAALQRSVGKICYHAGFEEFQPSALDTITDIASDYFTKLVHTLATYAEAPKEAEPAEAAVVVAATTTTTTPDAVPKPKTKPKPKRWATRFTTEETILHCLDENGLDVENLEGYVNDEVDRLGSKLSVMHERMKAHLADLLRPALTDAGPDGSNAFNDGSEQFVAGDFAEDIDEDFFGFKELGLDREFGLSTLSVPLHLLQNRMHNAYQAQNTSANVASASILEAPPPYEPITLQSLKKQIGLVQNFFLAKLHANGDEPLIEDEDLPQKQRFPKPRLPPTGKISSPRKRPIKEQGGNKSKKKKTEHIPSSLAPPATSAVNSNAVETAEKTNGVAVVINNHHTTASESNSTTTDTTTTGKNDATSNAIKASSSTPGAALKGSKLKLSLPPPLSSRPTSNAGGGGQTPRSSDAGKKDNVGSGGVGMMSPESIVAG